MAENIDILSEVEEFKELSGRRANSRVIDMIVDEFISNPGYAALTLDQALHSGEHISWKVVSLFQRSSCLLLK